MGRSRCCSARTRATTTRCSPSISPIRTTTTAPARRSCCRRTSCISRARCSSGTAAPISASPCVIMATGRSRCRSSLHFDSDFADLFEVRGLQRPRRGTVSRSVIGPDQALLSYLGLDNVTRRTLLTFHPAPNEISATKVSYRLVLAPGESKPIFLAVTCNAERALSAGAVPARIAGGASRAARTIARRRHGRDLERAVQRNPLPLGRRPRDAGDRDPAGRLSVCRHPLVLDHIRPRRDHHGAADAVVQSGYGARRAAPARGAAGENDRSCLRCRAGQDPA